VAAAIATLVSGLVGRAWHWCDAQLALSRTTCLVRSVATIVSPMAMRIAFLVVVLAGCGGRDALDPDAGFADCTPRTVNLTFPLDGPMVSFGTGWGAISNGTTYIALDHDFNQLGTAALPAKLPDGTVGTQRSGTSKHALAWSGQDVAVYLADGRVTLFASDGSGLRQGPVILGSTTARPQGLVHATHDGFEVEVNQSGVAGAMLWTIDSTGAPLRSTSLAFLQIDVQPFALLEVSDPPLLIDAFFCGGPGPGILFCPDLPGPNGQNSFGVVHGFPLGLDADGDGTNGVAVAFAGVSATQSPGTVMHAAWRGTGQTLAPFVWSSGVPLSIAWTGSFWEAVVLTDAGKLAEQRLDANLKVTATRELPVDPSFIRAPIVVADAHRAAIAIATPNAQTLTQVCY
jgi:hypothetical protein